MNVGLSRKLSSGRFSESEPENLPVASSQDDATGGPGAKGHRLRERTADLRAGGQLISLWGYVRGTTPRPAAASASHLGLPHRW